MDKKEITELKKTAVKLRIGAIEAVYSAASGHPGGSLSCADILTTLYFERMRVDPNKPRDPARDRFVLSKGHCSPALYSALSLKGFFPRDDLKLFRSISAHYSGHPDMRYVPGVDMSTGSLGQGISTAVGMAMAGKMRAEDYRVYSVMGDGEQEEGQVWEAAMSAAKYKLDNLCVFVDCNGLQIDGRVSDVMPIEPLNRKYEAFGWNVIEINGHDFEEIIAALDAAERCKGKPSVILARTVKGKGVSFMEDNAGWHGKAPNDEQYRAAIRELEDGLARILTEEEA